MESSQRINVYADPVLRPPSPCHFTSDSNPSSILSADARLADSSSDSYLEVRRVRSLRTASGISLTSVLPNPRMNPCREGLPI